MMRIVDCPEPRRAADLLCRDTAQKDVEARVAEIIRDVRERGDTALFEYCRWYDRAELESLEVSEQEIADALAAVPADFIRVLERARDNIEAFHKNQLTPGFEISGNGAVLGQRVTPLGSVGVYVPGGTAGYPSTVLMNIIPARLAGVRDIIMVTPPGPDGRVRDDILAAARIAGAGRIFKLGGAQAVAALAYGTGTVPAVDKITGPGNIYVATAKKQVFGQVGIDMIAGPSEVLIIADAGARADWIAADLLSQAEHDPMAAAILVTDSRKLAEDVTRLVETQLSALPRADIARAAIEKNSAVFIVADMAAAALAADAIAPEHLEIATASPMEVLPMISNAASVFLGQYAPEALGDYLAGPNHTLPTGGTARFFSPLSCMDFVKRSSYICYSRQALGDVYRDVAAFARHEGLEGHARSVEMRFEEERS